MEKSTVLFPEEIHSQAVFEPLFPVETQKSKLVILLLS